MRNKKVLLVTALCLFVLCVGVLYMICQRDKYKYDEYASRDLDIASCEEMMDESQVSNEARAIIVDYLNANKEYIISKGVPSSFFDDISITVHSGNQYMIVAGDKMISVGLSEDGFVQFCNIY